MSSPSQGPLVQGGSFGSGYTLPSRHIPASDPSASKRVCFYKSGDYTFNGHRMVINVRTFKTFDALLDALSKKVPLAFGVRTISTPRGLHHVKGLDQLLDGGSYVCSDQRRVKPINLKEMSRRQVPWNTTGPVSGRRRRPGGTAERARRGTDRVAIRTPKRLEVIKNRDPSVKRSIILHKRVAPTFDALLDYLSQILQFPVLKLYSTEGRRVDGLAALILCSGVVVAAGSEPFRLGSLRFQTRGQMAQAALTETSQPPAYTKPLLYGQGSRSFSTSSERYVVDQINKSRFGNLQSDSSVETCGNAQVENGVQTCVIPQDEDIEKSFRVNQDGSMTVEMKVRLKVKEEEMLRWTTTLSRASQTQRTAYPMVSATAPSSPDCNNTAAKRSNVSEDEEAKEANLPAEKKSSVGFFEENLNDSPEVIERKSCFRRAPTPGPKTRPELQELDQFTYMKRTSDNDTTEEYHVVRHSNRPVPKPRKTTSNSGVAEVLKVQHNGFGVKESVRHVYECQGCVDAYLGNEECGADGVPSDGSFPAGGPANDKKQSLSNDCDIDCSWQPPAVNPAQNEEILSLSSEPLSSSCRITNNLSSVADHLAQTMHLEEEKDRKKKVKHAGKQTGSVDKKTDIATGDAKNNKKTSSEKLRNKASVGKKSVTNTAKNGQRSKVTEKMLTKKVVLSKESVAENGKINPTKSANKMAPYNGHNVNVPDTKTAANKMRKSISDILKPNKSQKTLGSKSKLSKNSRSSKKSVEVNSAAITSVNPSPSEIHQYVENWLEKVSPDAVPFTDEDFNSHSKVEFQLGDDSEGEDKNQSQIHVDGVFRKSSSTLSVPLQNAVSMPSIRGADRYDAMKPHKSAVAISCVISSPKNQLQPVLRQICASVQCIHAVSYENTPNISKSTSLPDFPSQVASVFGSSCKAFLSFLSMVTLKDSLTGQSSEAMHMMESLQKISTIDSEKKQRASLSDLQSQASAQLKEQWQAYQIHRGKSESELLSLKISESGMDVVCQSGNAYDEQRLGIGELMDELNMPGDLRAEISSVIQEAISFCSVSENAFTETEQSQSTKGLEKIEKEAEAETNPRRAVGTDEDLETENIEPASLKGQRSGEVNEDENTDAKQDTVSAGDGDSAESEVTESDPISEKNDTEIHQEAAGNDQLEHTDNIEFSHEGERKYDEADATDNTTIGEKHVEDGVPKDSASKNTLEETLCLENSSCDEVKGEKVSTKSLSKYSSEEKCSRIHSVSEFETEEGESGCNLINPVGISQELLDFVNSALLSSSIIFTYDSFGNVKVAPNTKLPQKTGRDSAYGFNCLPSPNTSELTDYRPDSLESGGYKTQESLDIVTEGEESEKPFAVCRQRTQEKSLERANSKLSHATCKSKSSLSSNDSGAKVSRDGLSCFSAASSLKADNERAPETVASVPGKHSPDGVLIDQGRWLLKENHLIRRSPPVSLGMYGHLDNTSIDTSHAEDSPPHYRAQANPLTALSSSELEDMARPQTPKCTYYNMPHGSDSDPFMDDVSIKRTKSRVTDVKSGAAGDGTKPWADQNGSLSSFASVEFKMPDRRVHPEGESSAVAQARRASSGEHRVVQAQDSGETLQWRCHQFCPIL